MTISAATVAFLQTTDAEFRTWGSAIHSAIVAAGMTYVAQTGDIDFTTVTKPTGTNQIRGFRMYKFNDGLAEVYIRATFGSGNDATTQPEFGLQIGWSIDGAGNFYGLQASQRGGCRFGAGTYDVRACKHGAALSVNIGDSQVYLVERSRTASSGVATADGANLVIGNAVNSVNYSVSGFQTRGGQEYVPALGGVPGLDGANNWYLMLRRNNGGTMSRGGRIGASLIYPYDGGFLPPHVGLVAPSNSDVTTGTQLSVTVYGTSRNYRVTNLFGDGNSYTRIATLDEAAA